MEQPGSTRVCTDETRGWARSVSAGALPVCLIAKLKSDQAHRMAKGKAIKKEPDTWETVCQVTNTVLEVAKPVVHFTFIPLIIVIGMTMTEPRPSLAQLLGPM